MITKVKRSKFDKLWEKSFPELVKDNTPGISGYVSYYSKWDITDNPFTSSIDNKLWEDAFKTAKQYGDSLKK